MHPSELTDSALGDALRELADHVEPGGWDQPPQLFALVATSDLVASQPEWADELDTDGELSLVEQDHLPAGGTTSDGELEHLLGYTSWPAEVLGCALVRQITVLPPSAESDIDAAFEPLLTDPYADDVAVDIAHHHPDARTGRLFVGVLRDGRSLVLLQLEGDEDGELLTHPDLAANLVAALGATLENDPDL